MGRIAAVLAVLLFPWLAAAQDSMAAGMKALDEQRYAKAVQAFRSAVAAQPKDYAAHFHLALSLSLVNQDPEAITEYGKTLELKPGLYEAQLNLGILQLRQKQATAAIPVLEAAATQKPDQFRPVYYLAEALMAAGRPAEAEAKYKAAAALDPKSAATEAGWAHALVRQEKLAEAAPHFQAAARLDPAYSDALLELADLYEQRKQTAAAIEIYRQFSNHPGASERLGNLLLASGQPEEAVTVLESVVKQSPTAANRYALSTAYLRSKQPDKALAMLQQAVAAEPGNVDLRLVLGRMWRDQKKYPQAAQEFYRVTQGRPNSKEGWSELAAVLVLMEQYPQALAALDKVQALGGDTAGIEYLRAIVLDKNKMLEPALAAYKRFLDMSKEQNPDEEFKARQRVRILERELRKR